MHEVKVVFFQSVETQTIPPPRANYSATALQCIIFDYYQEDYAKKLREKEDEKPKRVSMINVYYIKVFIMLVHFYNAYLYIQSCAKKQQSM